MTIEVKNSIKPVDYIDSIKILEKRVDDIFLGKKGEFLWLLEHNTVYTAGTSSREKDLLNKQLKVIKSKRGGKHTVHSPGQRIIYFVLNLNDRKKSIRYLLSKIELCIINTLKEYNINSYPDKDNIGIWVNHNNEILKVASIGIRIRKWIAYHGFAINVNNDLSKFDGIVPCGEYDKKNKSIAALGVKNFSSINEKITKNFLSTFL